MKTEKVALITGGASGIGKETATYLTEKGYKIAIVDQNQEAATRSAKTIGAFSCAADVSDAQSFSKALEQILAVYPEIHVSVHCAGIASAKRILGREGPMPLEDFEQIIKVNLIGTFNVMRCVAERMSRQQPYNSEGEKGVIINTSSIAAFEGQVGQAGYSASKGGVAALTLPAARELSQFGIRVLTIAPGVFATPMMAEINESVKTRLEEDIVFPKRFGHPREFAKLVEHIIENTYLNGEVIRLDGGLRMGSKQK